MGQVSAVSQAGQIRSLSLLGDDGLAETVTPDDFPDNLFEVVVNFMVTLLRHANESFQFVLGEFS